MLTVNTNTNALLGQRNLEKSQGALEKAIERLSSGSRINRASDDAAGMAIATRMTSQLNGSVQAGRNANDGISLVQTADGVINNMTDNLQRMRTLAVQAGNATNSASDRAALNQEFQALSTEIDRLAQNTSFNGVSLLDGSFSSSVFQIGANTTSSDTISVAAIASARTSALGGQGTSYQSTVTGTATTTALVAGDLTLNGQQVGASTAGSSAGQAAASAYAIAQAINAVSSLSGVNAAANATSVAGVAATTGFAAVTTGATLTVNGIQIGSIAAGTDAIGQGANTAAAINLLSNTTGVTATASNTGVVTLTAADGRDIVLGAGFTAGNTGLTGGATTHGTVTLTSSNTAGIVRSGAAPASAGFTAGTTAPSSTLSVVALSAAAITTTAGATSAILAVDGALSSLNSTRSSLGAVQNRFTSVIASLQSSGENLATSRSRIQDADFATETTALSRGQILMQASSAMLVQANNIPQTVLSLLRG